MPINRAQVTSLLLSLVVFSVVGCSSLGSKFQKSKVADMGVFADQTISIISADVGLYKTTSVYVRDFFDESGEEEQQWRKILADIETGLLSIIRYSLNLVTIVETNKSDPDRVSAYVTYLKKIQHNAEQKLNLEPGYYDQIIELVKVEETFLGALQKAQPLVNAVNRAIQVQLETFDKQARIVEQKIDQKIDQHYSDVIAYQKALDKEKYAILRGIGYTYQIYRGDGEAVNKLIESDVLRKKQLVPGKNPSEEQLSAITEHLVKRLEITHKIWSEIEPDWDKYRATHMELDAMYKSIRSESNRIRAIVLYWTRAHQKMASGISTPAEWFDIDSAPAQLLSIGTKGLL